MAVFFTFGPGFSVFGCNLDGVVGRRAERRSPCSTAWMGWRRDGGNGSGCGGSGSNEVMSQSCEKWDLFILIFDE